MMGITPYQVGQMSDEELADLLNERWLTILILLDRVGGVIEVTEQELLELDYNREVCLVENKEHNTRQIVVLTGIPLRGTTTRV